MCVVYVGVGRKSGLVVDQQRRERGTAGAGGAGGAANAIPQGGGLLAGEQQQLLNEIVTQAFGTKLAQRRNPETDQAD